MFFRPERTVGNKIVVKEVLVEEGGMGEVAGTGRVIYD